MASEYQVRQYLAYWFQLGKRLMVNGGSETLLPEPVFQGDRYSDDFEACWRRVRSPESGDCFLEGTPQTIADLLTPAWEMASCARCSMPIPMPHLPANQTALECPCIDLPNWPNLDMPQPRSPVNSQSKLAEIRNRLTTSQPRHGTSEYSSARGQESKAS